MAGRTRAERGRLVTWLETVRCAYCNLVPKACIYQDAWVGVNRFPTLRINLRRIAVRLLRPTSYGHDSIRRGGRRHPMRIRSFATALGAISSTTIASPLPRSSRDFSADFEITKRRSRGPAVKRDPLLHVQPRRHKRRVAGRRFRDAGNAESGRAPLAHARLETQQRQAVDLADPRFTHVEHLTDLAQIEVFVII